MANEPATTDQGITKPSTVKGFMALPSTQKRVEDLLGDRASNFMTSVSSMIGADDKLAKCEPVSLFMACLTAAALNLPINKNLGFAHIIPYDNNKKDANGNWSTKSEAQFQMGWRGYVQLAQRTGQYKTIAATAVYEGQLVDENPLEGNTYDWKAKNSDKVIGYVASFTTITGFKHEVYMSLDEVKAHATKYSKAYGYDVKNKKSASPWSSNFDAMALKTVIKMLISKWGIMSIESELERAVTLDSSVVKEDGTPSYIDGTGDIVSDVKASDDKRAAILAANKQPVPDNVDPETGEIIEEPTPEPVAPAEPKKSVKEMAKDHDWTKEGKQAKLLESEQKAEPKSNPGDN